MKATLALVACIGWFNFAHAAETKVVEKAISASSVFVPGGFSSESDAYVVVNMMFPNTCYSWSRAQVDSIDTMTHEVRMLANVDEGSMCLQVFVPYTTDVRLGQLASGEHTIRFLAADGTKPVEKKLIVE